MNTLESLNSLETQPLVWAPFICGVRCEILRKASRRGPPDLPLSWLCSQTSCFHSVLDGSVPQSLPQLHHLYWCQRKVMLGNSTGEEAFLHGYCSTEGSLNSTPQRRKAGGGLCGEMLEGVTRQDGQWDQSSALSHSWVRKWFSLWLDHDVCLLIGVHLGQAPCSPSDWDMGCCHLWWLHFKGTVPHVLYKDSPWL